MGERWGELRFIPYTEGWVLDDDDVPQWHTGGPRAPVPRRVASDGPPPRADVRGVQRRRRAARRDLRGPAAQRPAARRLGPGGPADVRLPGRHRDQQRPAARQHAAGAGPAGARAAGAARQRGKLPAGLRVRAERDGRGRDGRRPARPAAAHQRRAVPAAGPPGLRDAPLLLLRPRPPRGHRHPAAHLRRGRPGRAAAGPPRRHVRLGLAAQLRRRRHRRRAALPAHPRRGHRGAQAARAAARAPRQP